MFESKALCIRNMDPCKGSQTHIPNTKCLIGVLLVQNMTKWLHSTPKAGRKVEGKGWGKGEEVEKWDGELKKKKKPFYLLSPCLSSLEKSLSVMYTDTAHKTVSFIFSIHWSINQSINQSIMPGKKSELRNLVPRKILTFGGNFYL